MSARSAVPPKKKKRVRKARSHKDIFEFVAITTLQDNIIVDNETAYSLFLGNILSKNLCVLIQIYCLFVNRPEKHTTNVQSDNKSLGQKWSLLQWFSTEFGQKHQSNSAKIQNTEQIS